jgi:hypothetical protein
MRFREWMVAEGMRELAKAYSDALKDVPENPVHHPEGTTLKHVKLVRRAILSAGQALQDLKSEPAFDEILSNLDFRLSEDEVRVLIMAAWLHDIGKTTATTIGGTPFRDAPDLSGKIQAIGHEKPDHYAPQVDRLLALAPDSTARFYESNKELINFLIERHMDFSHGGFPNRVISDYFEGGKVKNDRRIKLLLVLMWADKMGRAKAADLAQNMNKLRASAAKSLKVPRKSSAFSGTEDDFRAMLKSRGLDDASIESAVKAKFGGGQG